MPMPPPVPPVRTRSDSMTPTSTYSPIPRRKDFLPEFRWAALRWGRTTTPTRSCTGKRSMLGRLSVMAQPSPRLLVKGWWTSSTGCRRCANNNRPMEHGGELASALACQLAPSPTEPRLMQHSVHLQARLPSSGVGEAEKVDRAGGRVCPFDLAGRNSAWWNRPSILRTQYLANLAIDSGRVLRCFIDQVEPPFVVLVEFRLGQKIGSLHDGFDVIAEVVGQDAEFGNCLAL